MSCTVPSPVELRSAVQSLLPAGDEILELTKMDRGCSGVWLVKTRAPQFVQEVRCSLVFRDSKDKFSEEQFRRIASAVFAASDARIGPTWYSVNFPNRRMILQYIEEKPYPSYESDPLPYIAAMKALRIFHEKMKPMCERFPTDEITPFSFIFHWGEELTKREDMPAHLGKALEKCKKIMSSMNLPERMTVCHGDFHKGNTILSKETGKVFLIDFDTACLGDPLFDVVKFSVNQPHQVREQLFSAYLDRDSTAKEKAQFEWMDLALLMVVAVNRFRHAASCPTAELPRLSKVEMEKMCASDDPLPSFLDVPFADTSVQARQKGGVYALHEFLQRTKGVFE